MNISVNDWRNYINRLSAIDKRAAALMQEWMESNPTASAQQIANYAYAVATKYGEGAASLAADMYDQIAAAEGVHVPTAVVAQTPAYGDVAKAVNGARKQFFAPGSVSSVVGRLVKQAGADTMLKNAIRDGAQYAWVPVGDTCPFCIALAANGWQQTKKEAMWEGHAKHIHANCDCTYAVRFNENSGVKGYDPEVYRKMYYDAEGETSKERLNSMRRKHYAENKEAIRAQKREAYSRREIEKALKGLMSDDITDQFLKDATPGKGMVDFLPGFKESDGETDCANWIHKTFGGDISCLPENNGRGEPNPDYLWNGALWDLKSPKTSKDATIEQRIRHGLHQIEKNPGGVIFDYSRSSLSYAQAITKTDFYGNKRAKNDVTVIVKKDDAFRVLRIKKDAASPLK